MPISYYQSQTGMALNYFVCLSDKGFLIFFKDKNNLPVKIIATAWICSPVFSYADVTSLASTIPIEANHLRDTGGSSAVTWLHTPTISLLRVECLAQTAAVEAVSNICNGTLPA